MLQKLKLVNCDAEVVQDLSESLTLNSTWQGQKGLNVRQIRAWIFLPCCSSRLWISSCCEYYTFMITSESSIKPVLLCVSTYTIPFLCFTLRTKSKSNLHSVSGPIKAVRVKEMACAFPLMFLYLQNPFWLLCFKFPRKSQCWIWRW